MNHFIGIGTISDAYLNGKVLRFILSVQQQKPAKIPCVIFTPTDEINDFINKLQTSKKLVSLKGKLSSYEFESKGKARFKIDVVTYAKGIEQI